MSTLWRWPQSVPSQAFLVTAPLRQAKGLEGSAQAVAGASVLKAILTPDLIQSETG